MKVLERCRVADLEPRGGGRTLCPLCEVIGDNSQLSHTGLLAIAETAAGAGLPECASTSGVGIACRSDPEQASVCLGSLEAVMGLH